MKAFMIALGILEIGYGLYRVYKGDSFNDQMLLFIMGIILFATAFTLEKHKKSNKS